MFVVLLLFIFISIYGFLVKNINFSSSPGLVTTFPVVLLIIVVSGFQDGVGVDYNGYQANYYSNRIYHYEPGFAYLNTFLSERNFQFFWLLLLASSLTWLPLWRVFSNSRLFPWLYLSCLINGHFLAALNGIRQWIVISFFLMFTYDGKRSLWRYLIMILLGYFIHRSLWIAVVLSLIADVSFKFILNRGLEIYLCLLLLTFFFPFSTYLQDRLIFIADSSILPLQKYSELNAFRTYSDVVGSGFGVLWIKFVALYILYYNRRKLTSDILRNSYVFFTLGAILYLFFWKISFLNRVSIYYSVFGIFLVGKMLKDVLSETNNDGLLKIWIFLQLVFFIFQISHVHYKFSFYG